MIQGCLAQYFYSMNGRIQWMIWLKYFIIFCSYVHTCKYVVPTFINYPIVETRQSNIVVKLATQPKATAPRGWSSSITSQKYIQSLRMHKLLLDVVIPQPTENLNMFSVKLCFQSVLYRSY